MTDIRPDSGRSRRLVGAAAPCATGSASARSGRLVCGAALLLVAAGALALRLPRLADRPMHADEAVQAARSSELWLQGRYVYDPDEFHGPTLQVATLASLWLQRPKGFRVLRRNMRAPCAHDHNSFLVAALYRFGETTAATYRVVPACFGAGLILLLWPLADGLGKPAVLCAGVLLAISPAMVFYSRYYIHETLLVFFTMAAVAAGWRYFRQGRVAWCLAAGACVGLMQATKETSVITFFAMVVALVAVWLWGRLWGSKHVGRARPPRWHLLAALAVAVLVGVVFLSSFFTNPRGLVDSVRTYLPWWQRAGGATTHVHPWYYYLRIVAGWRDPGRWSEWLVLALAALGFAAALFPRMNFPAAASRSFGRWLGFFTLTLVVVYSAIPYKTPWCLLEFLWGTVLLAGVGAVVLFRSVPTWPLQGLVALLLAAAAGQLGWHSFRTSYALAADPRNPYVYAPTLADVERLGRAVEQLDEALPAGASLSIKVVWQDAYYWPLPWYLRRFDQIGYWDRLPANPAAAVVISSPQFDAALTEQLGDTHLMTGYYGVRPNVLAQLWVRRDVWLAHLRRSGRAPGEP